MLTVVRSTHSTIEPGSADLPTPVAELLARTLQHPSQVQWVTPTQRRRRWLVRHWLQRTGQTAALVPVFNQFDGLVRDALSYGTRRRPPIGSWERLCRIAVAWSRVTGRPASPGWIRELDRYVRDRQSIGFPDDSTSDPASDDEIDAVVRCYLQRLDADGFSDRMTSVAALAEEARDETSGPSRLFFGRQELVLFEGFHRLDPVELDCVAALSHQCDVLAWLVGRPGQRYWRTIESAAERLCERGLRPTVVDHFPDVTGPLEGIGRTLFPDRGQDAPAPCATTRDSQESAPENADSGDTEKLYRLESSGIIAELEAVASHIKADFLAAAASKRPLRLSDIAVVIPGAEYDAVVREVFPRAGLEFNLAGQALTLDQSRPARVLAAALALIDGQWRHELLFDFLNQPLVKSSLRNAHHLEELLAARPRARRRLDAGAWRAAWQDATRSIRESVQRWREGEVAIPDFADEAPEEFLAEESERAESIDELVALVDKVLACVDRLETALDERNPTGEPTTLVELADAALGLLASLGIEQWLTPPDGESITEIGDPVPWVELEKDQRAFAKLLDVMRQLAALPAERAPTDADGKIDRRLALRLALESETYQIRTEDDAGVQVFGAREIRGLEFRHVYALGLIEGRVPPLRQEGALLGRRLRHEPLRRQLEQQEDEAAFLFSRLFEAARERLVLSAPRGNAEETAPSRYLRAVEQQVSIRPLDRSPLVTGEKELALHLGRIGVDGAEQFEDAGCESVRATIETRRGELAQWQARREARLDARVDLPALLDDLFPTDAPFSPSALETYAACPFRFFGARVLGMRERDQDVTRLDYGSLLHRVLERFYETIRRERNVGADEPAPAVGIEDRGLLLRLFGEEWAKLAEGILPPDYGRLFEAEAGVADLFFEAVARIEREAGFGNWRNELVLRDDAGHPILLGVDGAGRAVFITGKVDRVDLDRADPRRGVIIDYKSGRRPTPKRVSRHSTDGRMLQASLYAAALMKRLPQLQIVGAAYLHLNERIERASDAVLSSAALASPKTRSAPLPLDPNEAVRKTIDFADRIRAGHFPLTDHDPTRAPDDTECTPYCPFRDACRQPEAYRTTAAW